jgi:hypothetical protein
MPECQRPLVLDKTEADDEALIGEMCHMVAESEDGPRGQSPLTAEQRDDYDNLILLCRNHHGEIDKQPATFPIEQLKAIKAAHEKLVRESLLGHYDRRRQQDDETYASYVDEWASRCNLDHWKDWSSFVLGGDRPTMTVEMDRQLEDLGPWLLGRVWPGRYAALERAFANFRVVVQDFRNTFHSHVERPSPEGEMLVTRKFYQIEEWDEERYERLSKDYDRHVDLVIDLMFELTRAANFVCDEVRSSLIPTFRLADGVAMVMYGPCQPDGAWYTFAVHYTPEEKDRQPQPYPSLEAFKQVRFTRERCSSNPTGE